MVVRRKKRTSRRRSQKLMAKIKRDGVFKGTGDWAGSQIGGSAGNVIKKAVPALMLLTVFRSLLHWQARRYHTVNNYVHVSAVRWLNF